MTAEGRLISSELLAELVALELEALLELALDELLELPELALDELLDAAAPTGATALLDAWALEFASLAPVP